MKEKQKYLQQLPSTAQTSTHLEFSQNLPQIRVRSESNVEFCTHPQQPPVNKLQRTSSFSGQAMNTMEALKQQQPQNSLIPMTANPIVILIIIINYF